MTDGAAGSSAKLAVSGHMASDAANDGSLVAPLGIRSGREAERNCGCASRYENPLHLTSPISKNTGSNTSEHTFVPTHSPATRSERSANRPAASFSFSFCQRAFSSRAVLSIASRLDSMAHPEGVAMV
jgi:hypothetical protein